MILVADSGSTKCDWVFTDGTETRLTYHTMGFNPFFHSTDLIESEIRKNEELAATAPAVEHVFFYGAGASHESRNEIVAEALRRVRLAPEGV